MWDMHGGVGWWMVFGWLWFVLFWGVIVGLVSWAVYRLSGRSEERHPGPLEIAKERYARGEISAEEFERIRRALREAGSN